MIYWNKCILRSRYLCSIVALLTHRLECRFKLLLWANDFPHTSQENGFSPVCVRVWTVRWCFLEQVNSQWEQEYGLSPVWVIMWEVRFDLYEEVYSQTLQKKGRSWVWVRSCMFNLLLWINDFPQCGHVYGFSPLWTIKCLFSSDAYEKHLSHILQWYFFVVLLVPTKSVSVFSWVSVRSLFTDSSLSFVVVVVVVVDLFFRQSTKLTLTSNLQRFITILLCSGRRLDDGWSSLSSTGSSCFTTEGCWLYFPLIESSQHSLSLNISSYVK